MIAGGNHTSVSCREAAKGVTLVTLSCNHSTNHTPLRLAKSRLAAVARLHGACASLSQAVRPASSPIGEPRRRKFQLFKNCCILFWGNVLYFPRSVRVGRPGLPLGADISPAFYRENAGVFRKEGDSGPDFLRSAACFLRSFCGAPAPTLSLLMFLLKGDFNIWQKN